VEKAMVAHWVLQVPSSVVNRHHNPMVVMGLIQNQVAHSKAHLGCYLVGEMKDEDAVCRALKGYCYKAAARLVGIGVVMEEKCKVVKVKE
jgi:hypothetical protein